MPRDSQSRSRRAALSIAAMAVACSARFDRLLNDAHPAHCELICFARMRSDTHRPCIGI
jgi:hypothetical protein